MAEEPKKPRKIKDLKARLGRTIAPQTQKDGVPVPAPAAGAKAAAVPPPAVKAQVAPPPGLAPAPGVKPQVAAPPFAQPKPAAPAKPKPVDPFAAAEPAAAGPREVKLVVDDRAVNVDEVGKKSRGLVFALIGVGLALGLVVGGFFMHTNNQNRLWNLGVNAGDNVYAKVRESSDTVTKAQTYVKAAMDAARPGQGKAASVDRQAIEALIALEHPLPAGAFARENYNLFTATTVDDLFEYYNNVNILWSQFERLNARTAGDRAEQLTQQATNPSLSQPVGCAPEVVEEQLGCNLVFMFPNEDPEAPGTVLVSTRPTPGGRAFPRTPFIGGEQNLLEAPETFVIQVDNEKSVGVLGQQTSAFASYVALLGEINTTMERTLEVQGRLEQNLGEVARYEPRFALFE
ncbi:MAG: hypothetical protein AAGF12_27535 [Myxococcota bacterium]